jgi:hypothetical protein
MHQPVGIIGDFPANRDQICLIIAQYPSGVVAVEGQSYLHGHDIGAAPHLFEWRLIADLRVGLLDPLKYPLNLAENG